MKPRLFPFLLLCVTLIFIPGDPSADELLLTNGDRITGQFVQLEAGYLMFATGYADSIKVQVDQVASMKTDAPVMMYLEDGTMKEGTAFFNGLNALEETEQAAIDMKDATSIYTSPKPPIRYIARANVGVTNQNGNSDTEQYRIDAEGVARTEKQRFTLGGEFNREEAADNLAVKNWKLYGLYDYFLSQKWYLNANALFENDEFADLDLRTTLGAGAGHQIFESEGLNLSISAGLAYVEEDFIVARDRDYPVAQWLINYDQFFFNRFVQLFHSNNGYISLENGNNWLINTRQGLRFSLVKGFMTTLQYNYDYKNDPSPEATSRWDSTFMFLLGYQFGN